MNNLFILDGQNDGILDHINKKYVTFNEHEQDLPTYKNVFRFTTLGDKRYAEYLGKRNGIIAPGEDGELLEFRIFEAHKYRDQHGLKIEVWALSTSLDLKTARVIQPHKTSSETAEWHAKQALAGMPFQVGEVAFKGTRTITFENYTNPYDYLLRIAREFDLELRFYITTDGSRVTGRYVDLVEQVGEWRGRTVEFGRDLQGINRIEKTDRIVTALLGVGPEREDGTRLEVLVEDEEALERWGRNGQHIIEVYEPISDRLDMTEDELRQYTRTELNKRIDAVVSYETSILDLENVPGLENKKIRFGDTIRIKDLKFNPPLYLEARIHNQKRDVFNRDSKQVILGDYVEYTEEEVTAIWKQLRQEIRDKISQAELIEYAEPKIPEQPTPPPNPEKGDKWVDTSEENPQLKLYDGEDWTEIKGEKGDPGEQGPPGPKGEDGKDGIAYMGSEPPENPATNSTWFKTDSDGNVIAIRKWTGEDWETAKMDAETLVVETLSALSADLGNVTAGRIIGVDIDGGVITQVGEDNRKIILDDMGFQKVDSAGNTRVRITNRDRASLIGFSEAMIEFNPYQGAWGRFIVATDAHGLGDAFIGYPDTGDERIFVIRNWGNQSRIMLDSSKVEAYGELLVNGMPFYEEGEWTPIIDSTGESRGHAYNRREGKYVRQGNLVTVFFDIEMSVKSSSATGSVYIRGLPYSPRIGEVSLSGSITTLDRVSLPSGRNWVVPFRTGSFIGFKAIGDNVLGVNLNIQDNWSGDSRISGTATYRI